MSVSYGKLSLAALSLTAIGLLSMPINAHAQDNNPPDAGGAGADDQKANKKIDLDLESTNLFYALKLLFSQVKADFTIDESLKALTVTAHLTQVPFRVALDTLLKATGTPLTYKLENGIYSVVPKVEDTNLNTPLGTEDNGNKEPTPGSGGTIVAKLPSTSLVFNAIDIVTALGGRVITVDNQAGFGNGGLGGGLGGLGGGLGGLGGGGFGGGLGGFGGGGLGGGGLGGGLGGFGGGGLGGGGCGGGGFGGGGFGGGGLGGGGFGGGGGGGRRGGGGF